ncbi:MAG: tRNA-guanine transglycosylase [Acidobacteria bacterium]|nr:tRNA-guanine transglycosylase [Acidobacteriota bacterium]
MGQQHSRGRAERRPGRSSRVHDRYREDPAPLEESCPCPTCRNYSRGYLRHLYMSREILSMRLNTYHNLYFYLDLMRRIRAAIPAGTLDALAAELRAADSGSDEAGS